MKRPNPRTLKALWKKLTNTPVLPLLFIQEWAKTIVTGEPRLFIEIYAYSIGFDPAPRLFVMAFLSVLAWVLSDAISVDIEKSEIVGE